MSARIARLIDRSSDQVVKELDFTALTPAEVEVWYLRQAVNGVFVKFRLEWAGEPALEED